jgi:ribosomal protein S18 acetylase RimI-like enzyme
MGYNWLVCDAIDEERRRAVGKGLMEYNASHCEPLRQRYYEPGGKPRPLDVYLLDAQGQVVGGLVGETLWHWLYLDDVWLEERLRGQGHGREMLRRAEEEARRRGCTKARLSTMSFQARGFYEKLGYRVVGELEDWPPGCSYYWMMKELR